MLVKGIQYLRPELLTTSPKTGFTQAETGGFLDPLIGTFMVAAIGIAIALPLGIAIAVWLSEFGRPFALARIVESTVEMIAGTPVDRAGAVRHGDLLQHRARLSQP